MAVASPSPQLTDAAVASGEFNAALLLARAGLMDDASSMLAALSRRLRGDLGLALLAARAASAAGDYATAWSLVATRFAPFLARPLGPVPDDIWQMAFPRAYWPEVAGAAAKSKIDPLLLLSLMRRESRFVATARSRTGALGLFQIMPETAKEVVAVVEDPSAGERLTETPASAELAARLVRRIMTRFGDAPAPVVAAYNAGEDRVQVWWRAAEGLPEDLFVDSIPYGETRQYVREVLANYAIYKQLYK
jgi:soluble lytic murein transglycosylase